MPSCITSRMQIGGTLAASGSCVGILTQVGQHATQHTLTSDELHHGCTKQIIENHLRFGAKPISVVMETISGKWKPLAKV